MRLLKCLKPRVISITVPPTQGHLVGFDQGQRPSSPSADHPQSQQPHDNDTSLASLSPQVFAPSNRKPTPPQPSSPSAQQQEPAAAAAAASSSSSAATKFVPTSIPDLHPEYAHAEPYCFVARTESARVVVDRMRGARGQPSVDHAHILRQQGMKVVRGPSYAASKAVESKQAEINNEDDVVDKENERAGENQNHNGNGQGQGHGHRYEEDGIQPAKKEKDAHLSHSQGQSQGHGAGAKSPRRPSVPLRVETPSPFVKDVDSSSSEEGVGETKPPTSPSTPSQQRARKSLLDIRRKSSTKAASRSFIKKNNNSRRNIARSTERVEILSEHVAEGDEEGEEEGDSSVALNDPVNTLDGADDIRPPPTPMEGGSSPTFQRLIKKHMDNTPTELLAPIRVPRTSVVHDSDHPLSSKTNANAKGTRAKAAAKSETSSQRYADAEGDTEGYDYSGRASVSRPFGNSAEDISIGSLGAMAETASSPSQSHVLRARRKSKPLLSAVVVDSPSLSSFNNNNLASSSHRSPSPAPSPSLSLSRGNAGVGSLSSPMGGGSKSQSQRNNGQSLMMPPSNPLEDAQNKDVYDGRDLDMMLSDRPETMNQHHRGTPFPNEEVMKNVKPLDVPSAVAMPPAIGRKSAAAIQGSRKTVSFQDAAPVVIEPNLRAPPPATRSLPREETNGPPSIGSVLSMARDSVTGMKMPLIPLIDVDEDEEEEESETTFSFDVELRRSQAMPDRERERERSTYGDGSASDSVDVTHINERTNKRRTAQTQEPQENVTAERGTREAATSTMNNNYARHSRETATMRDLASSRISRGMPDRERTRTSALYNDKISANGFASDPAGAGAGRSQAMPDRERTRPSRTSSYGYGDGSASDGMDGSGAYGGRQDGRKPIPGSTSSPVAQRGRLEQRTMAGRPSSPSPYGTGEGSASDSVDVLQTGGNTSTGTGTLGTMTPRERSDVSNGSFDNSSMDEISSQAWANRRNSNRGSRRVSVRDKDAIRAANKRQSTAVAQAMSEQIRGVPRSAMLAYSANEVIIDDDEVADDEATATESDYCSEGGSLGKLSVNRGSFSAERRMARASKVINFPQTKPGEIPPPPPPPPFQPRRIMRSVRMPPPPPTWMASQGR